MPVIACAEPACNRQISYDKGDPEVHLYCILHRTKTGRHAAVRKLILPIKQEQDITTIVAIKRVVMICPSKKCRNRISVSHSDWMSGKEFRCGDCGGRMVYHKHEDAAEASDSQKDSRCVQ